MLGLRLKLILLVVSLLFMQACSRLSHVEGAPRFTLSHVTTAGDGSELSVDRRATRTWKDYDGDGIPDRKDFDIDNDGIPNLADQYPFDGKRMGEDINQNLIPDFIDLNFHSSLVELAPLQEKIKNELDLFIMNGSDDFTKDEIEEMKKTLYLEVIQAKMKFEKLKVIVRYSQEDQPGESRADYDHFWQQISFYQNENHLNNTPAFNASFVHELGHVHAVENPAIFDLFVLEFHDWQSPSVYGASSPEEGYAENFLYQLFIDGKIEIDPVRFNLKKEKMNEDFI